MKASVTEQVEWHHQDLPANIIAGLPVALPCPLVACRDGVEREITGQSGCRAAHKLDADLVVSSEDGSRNTTRSVEAQSSEACALQSLKVGPTIPFFLFECVKCIKPPPQFKT